MSTRARQLAHQFWLGCRHGSGHVPMCDDLTEMVLTAQREAVNRCAAVIEDLPVIGTATAPYLAGLKAARNALVALPDAPERPTFCGKCNAGYVFRAGDNFIGRRCECNPRPDAPERP